MLSCLQFITVDEKPAIACDRASSANLQHACPRLVRALLAAKQAAGTSLGILGYACVMRCCTTVQQAPCTVSGCFLLHPYAAWQS